MGVPSAAAPPVGTVGVGELLADAQSRTIWLGVPGSIDPAQSLLCSDIVGLQQDIAANLVTAKAYTDTGLAGKSNVGHHHAISDVDGLEAALGSGSSSLPTGCIVLWSGSLGSIPGGWALCNGANGTPDLRDKFILGAGGSVGAALSTGGALNQTATSSNAGGHTPTGTIGDTTLTLSQIPQHAHSITDPGHVHTVSDPGHTHQIWQRNTANMASVSAAYVPGSGAGGTVTNSAGVVENTTGIGINAKVTGISVNNAGGGGSHNHTLTMTAVGGHTHTITVPMLPPYIILGYIMKV